MPLPKATGGLDLLESIQNESGRKSSKNDAADSPGGKHTRTKASSFPFVLIMPERERSAEVWYQLRPRQSPELGSNMFDERHSPFRPIPTDEADELRISFENSHEEDTISRRKDLDTIPPSPRRVPVLFMRLNATTNPFLTDASNKNRSYDSLHDNIVVSPHYGSQPDTPFMPCTPSATLDPLPSVPPPCRPKYDHKRKEQRLPLMFAFPDF